MIIPLSKSSRASWFHAVSLLYPVYFNFVRHFTRISAKNANSPDFRDSGPPKWPLEEPYVYKGYCLGARKKHFGAESCEKHVFGENREIPLFCKKKDAGIA